MAKKKKLSFKMQKTIRKKVKQHQRKIKKDKKLHPEKYKKKADPGVPNSLPFKGKILKEAAEYKKDQEAERNKRREELKKHRKELRDGAIAIRRSEGKAVNAGKTIENLVTEAKKQNALQKAGAGEKNSASEARADQHHRQKAKKSYYDQFLEVVKAADVILEVLDARDPLGTRCAKMEQAVRDIPGKRLVLVLNKADLVPQANLIAWLKYLRRELPTVGFKAASQKRKQMNRHWQKFIQDGNELLRTPAAMGADVLLQLLKNYNRDKESKSVLVVGVVGLPNVGKSSLINSLKRTKACGVSSAAGFTRNRQEVKLDSKLHLIDTPGVIRPGENLSYVGAIMRNIIKIDKLTDPITPAKEIYSRADPKKLMLYYKIPKFTSFTGFLAVLARRCGRLKKGGVSNVEAAAQLFLYDWNLGRIKYYTNPPPVSSSQISATLSTELSKEFDIESMESTFLSLIQPVRPSQVMAVQSAGPVVEEDLSVQAVTSTEAEMETDGETTMTLVEDQNNETDSSDENELMEEEDESDELDGYDSDDDDDEFDDET